MRLKGLLFVAFMAICTSAVGQFYWPEDPSQRSEAQTLWTLFDDEYKQGNFEGSKIHLDNIIEKFPGLSTSVYINGIKVWKETWKSTKDDPGKKAAADKIMDLYSKRYEAFPDDKNKSIDRYAIDAVQFYYKDRTKTQMLLDVIREAYDLKGDNAYYSLGRWYMQMAVFGVARKLDLSDDDLLEIYNRCTKHIDFQIAKAKSANKDTKRYDDIKKFVDEKLADLKLIDCDFVVEKLVPEFNNDPTNFELANKIFVFAFDGGCTDSEWFTQAAQVVFDSNPNYGVGYMLGVKFGANKDFEKSKEYFAKAADLTDDNTDKGKAYKQIASTERIKGNKKEARDYAIKAAEIDPALVPEMYVMIGDMVMGSSECDKRVTEVEDRARFIAAYDYYAKSGNGPKMAAARAQFPTAENIFTANKEQGESFFVGCWIQKSVKLAKRPTQ